MARTSVTTQPIVLAGLVPTMTAPAGTGSTSGDIVDVGRNMLVVKNADASSMTVTVETPETIDGDLDIEDRTVTVAAGATAYIPLTSTHYRQTAASATSPTDVGRAYVDYSSVTSLTRAVVSL